MRTRAGFTVMELVVVLGIVAALLAAMVPLGFQLLQRQREDATREQLADVREAILGNPAAEGRQPAGGPVRPDRPGGFGFNGDVGALPDSLEQLFVQDGLPAFQVDPDHRLGAGWRGPYLSTSGGTREDALRDAFGRPLEYSTASTTVDGVEWAGWIRSAGPDGVADALSSTSTDDIVAPLREDEVRGRVTGFLRHGTGEAISDAGVLYVFRAAGQVTTTTLVTDADGRYQGPEHAFGPVLARTAAAPGGGRFGFVPDLARVYGSSFHNVDLRSVNVTRTDVTVTSLTASWTGISGVCYTDLRFAGVDVDGSTSTRHCSGETVSFTTPVQVPGGGGFGNSVPERRFNLDRAEESAPELVVAGATGRQFRGEALIQLLDWEDGSGVDTDVRGIQLTVTLSDGSSTTQIVP